MKNMIYDPNDEPKIAVFPAIREVAKRHFDLDAKIGHGVQRILARRGDPDPVMSGLNLSSKLSEAIHDPDNPKYDQAKVLYVDGFLEIKHQLRPNVTQYITEAARDMALANDEDHNEAMSTVYEVFNMAGSGMQHLNEQQELNRRMNAKARAEREQKHLEAARRRAKDRRLKTG